MKQISVFITNSLGEIDVLLPLFSALRNKVEIKIIFNSDTIYKEFKKNEFYIFVCNKLHIKYKRFKTVNKFDFKSNFHKNILFRRTHKLFLRLKLFLLIFDLYRTKIIMHETSSAEPISTICYYASKYFSKKILVHHHSQSINSAPNKDFIKEVPIRKYADTKTFLLWHEISSGYAKSQGFDNQFLVGHPIFFREWIGIVREYANSQFKNKQYIVLFTRGIHKYYMEEEKYKTLLISSYDKIRKIFGEIQIFIKPHPREDKEFINKIIVAQKMNNTFLTDLNLNALSINATCVISFWTSCILSSLALEIPSIEYFIEPDNFREKEYPEGSLYLRPEFDIKCTDNSEILEDFLVKVRDKYEFNFEKLKSNFKYRDLSCFY